jgi:hypothetical protein
MRELSLDDLFFGLEEGCKYDIYVENNKLYRKDDTFVEYKLISDQKTMRASFKGSEFNLFDLLKNEQNDLLIISGWRFFTED